MSTEPRRTGAKFMPRGFPPELLLDIIARLPVKSVLRFKCASKSIRSMVEEDFRFINRHLKRTLEAKRDRILLLKDGKRKIFYCVDLDSAHHSVREISPPLLLLDGEFEIVGSCNGLFCLVSNPTHMSREFRNAKNIVVLWNVLTGEYKILPIDEAPRRPDVQERERTRIGPVYGFGYDAISNDYKVVRITQFQWVGHYKTEVKVCSVKENTWRNVQSECPYELSWPQVVGFFVNGAIDWGGDDQVPDNFFPKCFVHHFQVVAFNLQTEEFGLVPYKNAIDLRFHFWGAIDGQLSMTHRCGDISQMRGMNDYVVIDSRLALVSLGLTGRALVGDLISRVRPLANSKSRNEALRNVEFGINRVGLTWHDLATQQTKYLEIPHLQSCFELEQAEVAVTSLVSLGNSIGIGRN